MTLRRGTLVSQAKNQWLTILSTSAIQAPLFKSFENTLQHENKCYRLMCKNVFKSLAYDAFKMFSSSHLRYLLIWRKALEFPFLTHRIYKHR